MRPQVPHASEYMPCGLGCGSVRGAGTAFRNRWKQLHGSVPMGVFRRLHGHGQIMWKWARVGASHVPSPAGEHDGRNQLIAVSSAANGNGRWIEEGSLW